MGKLAGTSESFAENLNSRLIYFITTAINSSATTLSVYKAYNYRISKKFQSEKIIFLPGESFLDVKVSDVCLITQARLQCHLEQHLDHGRILTTFLQYPKRNSEKEKSK